jgi:hypothetical protein
MNPKIPAQEPTVEYTAPAIIYEGKLTTRAGTPSPTGGNSDGFDPSLLFGGD